jgi:abequosyltransferase
MNKNSPLLSICIPTYNRCEILERTLRSIVEQDSFDQRVEIVISDNCSTDNTKKIVCSYQSIYKNIIYHRNENNIYDENFTKVLSLGNGEYLKLMNDTIMLKSGVLENYLLILEKYHDKKIPLFFYENNFRHANETIFCSDLNQFVDSTSLYIGWVGNFGAWKVDFDDLKNKNRCSLLQWLQIDWTLRIIENKKSVIIFNDWIESQLLNKKGGYNFFEVHIDNYLFLFLSYLNKGVLSYSVFRKEKNRLLKYFLTYWIYMIILQKDKLYNFEITGWSKILWRNYKSYPLLYIVFSKQILKFSFHYIINIITIKKKK